MGEIGNNKNIIAVEEITNNYNEALETVYNKDVDEIIKQFYESTETENNINIDMKNMTTNNLSEAIEETENYVNKGIKIRLHKF